MKKYLALLVVLVAFSCGQKEEVVKIPEDIIQMEQMIHLTAETSLIKGAHNARLTASKSREENINSYFKSMFKENGVTAEEYNKSYKWYMEHPDKFSELYTAVMEELDARQVAHQAEVQEKKKKK